MRHLLCGVLALLSVAGCAHDSFLIEITPEADGFRREFTAWHVTGPGQKSQPAIVPLSEEQLRGLEQIYGPRQPIEDGSKHRFSGSFAEHPPSDVGGYGSFVRHVSPLGSLAIYCERFRGSADLESALAERRQAADQLAELLSGWLRSEMGDAPEWTEVESFLGGRFRQDLKNLTTYAWTANAAEQFQAASQQEFVFRGWQYLCERNYLRAAELPRLARGGRQDPEILLGALQRALARQIGVADDQPIPASLAWLADPQRVQQSFGSYLRQSPRYQAHLSEWRAQHPGDAEAEPPDPEDMLGDLVFRQLLGFRFFGSSDRLEVRLHCGRQPVHTNGEWDADTGRVTWQHELAPDRSLPAFSYAAWCEPETEFQAAHFGRVLLDGEELGEYVLWHEGLAAHEADAWNRFLQDCRPGDQLRSRLGDFRFPAAVADPSAVEEADADLAETPRRLLLNALEED